jgi:uncharacterized protein YkwD
LILVIAALLGASLLWGTQAAVATTPSPSAGAADAQAVFQVINKERAAHGLRALNWNTRLVTAAHAHNLLMAKLNKLSHQLPGEPSLGTRVTNAGYAWRAVGENIGYSLDWSRAGVLAIQAMMYDEVPPNDAHRRNILSSAFRAVGVDVLMDARHHKVWLTEVFAQPR